MFKIDAGYSEYYDSSDPNYPGGKGVSTTTIEGVDGTKWDSPLMNHLIGVHQALFIAAFGTLNDISGEPDNAKKSDILNAILELIRKGINSQYFVKEIKGPETIIPLAEFNIEYDSEKKYSIFISPQGEYREFLPFGAEIKEDGLHVYAQRLVNNQVIPGTRRIKWGCGRKWGDGGKWGEYGVMPVNIFIKEC